jgi:hypothetical protein
VYGERLQKGCPQFHRVRQGVGADRAMYVKTQACASNKQHNIERSCAPSSRFRRRTGQTKLRNASRCGASRMQLFRSTQCQASPFCNRTPVRISTCGRGSRSVERGFSFQRFTARWLAHSTYRSRLRRTSANPCTNTVLQCPDKPFSVFFWKYAGSGSKQAQARQLKHSQRSMPQALN